MGNRNLEHDWTLGSAGKPEADPGSVDWAIYTRARIQHLLEETSSSVEHLSYAYDAMIKHQGWRHLYARTKQPFNSFEQFCFEVKPWGLGYKREVIEGIIHERKTAQQIAQRAEPLNQNGGDRKSEQVESVLYDNTDFQGTSASYLTRRIARDYPVILEEMKEGKYPSVRAAAKAAGIIRELTTVEKVQKLWLKMTPEEKEQFQIWAIEQVS